MRILRYSKKPLLHSSHSVSVPKMFLPIGNGHMGEKVNENRLGSIAGVVFGVMALPLCFGNGICNDDWVRAFDRHFLWGAREIPRHVHTYDRNDCREPWYLFADWSGDICRTYCDIGLGKKFPIWLTLIASIEELITLAATIGGVPAAAAIVTIAWVLANSIGMARQIRT